MKKSPSIISVDQVIRHSKENLCCINDRWVPSRSEGYPSLIYRIKAALLVFQGKADALIWPEGQ